MDYAVCSREFERDYTWCQFPQSRAIANSVPESLASAFGGSLTASRFAALMRCPGTIQDVILCISVSTNRRDFSHTQIRTMAFLRAETSEETGLLAAFFAECLRKPDAETLYNAESNIAKAVESLYQTKKSDDFLRFCGSLPAANGSGAKPTGRWEIPRDEVGSRQAMAESLPALIGGGKPFLIALTDRLPTDVLDSLGSMFDHATVHIFSKAVSAKLPLPGGGPNTRVIAAAIGGAILLSALLVAAGRSCRKAGGGGEAGGGTNNLLNAIYGEGTSTTVPASSPNNATHTLPLSERGGEPARETQEGSSATSDNPVKAGENASVLTGVQTDNPVGASHTSFEDLTHQKE